MSAPATPPYLDSMEDPQDRYFWPGFSVNKSPLLKPPRLVLGRVPIDRLSMDDAVNWIVHALKYSAIQPPLLIMGPNAHLVTLAATHDRFAQALQAADLSIPDGISVVLASRLLGRPVPERVPGGDLMERLCAAAARHGFSVFFLGGLPGAAEGAAANLTRRYPALRVAGTYCPPMGFENLPMEAALVRQIVTRARPDILCVAFGAPKQEIWMHENCATLPIGAALSVGAALDTQAGLRKRAPRWTHALGMEWLYRLVREPRRLWRRYLIGNCHFIFLALHQWIAGGSGASKQDHDRPVLSPSKATAAVPVLETEVGSVQGEA